MIVAKGVLSCPVRAINSPVTQVGEADIGIVAGLNGRDKLCWARFCWLKTMRTTFSL